MTVINHLLEVFEPEAFDDSTPFRKMLKNCEEFPLENIAATR